MRGAGRDLVADEDDVAAVRRAGARSAVATWTGVSAAFAPPATAMLFSPRASTRISATPVGSPARVTQPVDVDALRVERGARLAPEGVVARPHR